MLGDFPSFTRDDHEEVLLTGGGLRKILHDIPVTLNQILYFICLSISVLLLSIFFIFILTAILIPLLLSGFLLLGSFLQKNKTTTLEMDSVQGLIAKRVASRCCSL